jgi:hypothetical protein
MNEVEPCKHGCAAPRQVVEHLDDWQGGLARHKCAVCAYEEGYKAGLAEGIRRARKALQALTNG